MSWHFSQALVEGSSQATYWGGERYAPVKSTGTDGPSSWPDRMTATFLPSQYGMTYELSTAFRGEGVLTWYLAAFPVRRIPRRLEVRTSRMTSGRKCGEWWQRQLPGTYLPRTSKDAQSTAPQTTLRRWVTRPAALPFPRQTWARIMNGSGIGFVHTPTATANYACPSMQKWPGCRAFVSAFGNASPEVHEHLMGWPDGWSDLQPLETDKFRAWLQRHGGSWSHR